MYGKSMNESKNAKIIMVVVVVERESASERAGLPKRAKPKDSEGSARSEKPGQITIIPTESSMAGSVHTCPFARTGQVRSLLGGTNNSSAASTLCMWNRFSFYKN